EQVITQGLTWRNQTSPEMTNQVQPDDPQVHLLSSPLMSLQMLILLGENLRHSPSLWWVFQSRFLPDSCLVFLFA
ncbi:hypothetical protein DKP78_26445, partial [Enterococcus faecium]